MPYSSGKMQTSVEKQRKSKDKVIINKLKKGWVVTSRTKSKEREWFNVYKAGSTQQIIDSIKDGDHQKLFDLLDRSGSDDINGFDNEGMTPLHYAALQNSMTLCTRLTRYGANREYLNFDLKRPVDLTTSDLVREYLTNIIA
jgi:hypothetical protein